MLRRYIAEFLGTFALVFAGCGMRAMVGGDTHDFAGILMVHMVFAFTITSMIYTLTNISGAHFNPAITLGFATARCFPFRYVLPYWFAQFGGALLASTLHFILLPEKAAIAHYGANMPKIGIGQALGIEIVLTFFLMLVSMATGTDRRTNRGAAGIAVGLTVLLDGLFGNSLTGGSMNPARSLAPALFAGGSALGSVWIYFVAPVIGSLLAVVMYQKIRGGGKYIKGVPEELLPLRREISQVQSKNKEIVERSV